MPAPRRLLPRAWLLIPAAALVFLVWSNVVRVRHVDYVSGLAGGEAVSVDPASPTGYTGGVRLLVAPERDARSLQWIVQTQQMVRQGVWDLEHVDYDNAPMGRAVLTPSPYRWWLAAVGWVGAGVSGLPLPAAIERAGLWADPGLQAFLLIGVAILLARSVGLCGAAWGALGVAVLFPLGGAFLPGRPDETGLALVLAVLSVLPLTLVGFLPEGRRVWPWFLGAGLSGGAGLAVAVHVQVPVLLGIAAGALAAMVARRNAPAQPPGDRSARDAALWRVWALAGAGAALAGWLVDRAPAGFAWNAGGLDRNHPVYTIAWLGLGELLCVAQRWMHGAENLRRDRVWLSLAAGAAAVVLVPVELVRTGQAGFLASGDTLARVSDLPGEPTHVGIASWIGAFGFSLPSIALLVPVAVAAVLVAGVVARARRTGAFASVLLALMPVAVCLAGAFFRPGYWTVATALLLGLIGPMMAAGREASFPTWMRRAAGGLALIPIVLGAWLIAPRAQAGVGESVSPAEVRALIERDLAWWLARQAPEPGVIVLAPPELTAALIYHGSLRGLGSPYPENEDGFRISVRLAGASTAEGAALAQNRGVRYIVMPSWDTFLDEYARLGASQPEHSIIGLLHRWQPPRWLRPVPYLIPQVEGLAAASVGIFEVVELQDNPTALARLAEYFVETGAMPQAGMLAAVLKERFPDEPTASVARARVAWARRNALEFREAVEGIRRMMEDGATEVLTWDRRAGLAVVLGWAARANSPGRRRSAASTKWIPRCPAP